MTNTKTAKGSWIALTIFFILVNIVMLAAQAPLTGRGISLPVVLAGNTILFAATLGSLLLYQRAMTHASTSGFLRNSYGGLMVKLFACLIALLAYVLIRRETLNKPGIFACIVLYFIYSVIEMRSLARWNKSRVNA